jgi:hypothetical protein
MSNDEVGGVVIVSFEKKTTLGGERKEDGAGLFESGDLGPGGTRGRVAAGRGRLDHEPQPCRCYLFSHAPMDSPDPGAFRYGWWWERARSHYYCDRDREPRSRKGGRDGEDAARARRGWLLAGVRRGEERSREEQRGEDGSLRGLRPDAPMMRWTRGTLAWSRFPSAPPRRQQMPSNAQPGGLPGLGTKEKKDLTQWICSRLCPQMSRARAP